MSAMKEADRMSDIVTIRRGLRFVHVEPDHDNALEALARVEADITAARAEIERLKLTLGACTDALRQIEDETEYYEQSHLRRVWKIARAAIEIARKELG